MLGHRIRHPPSTNYDDDFANPARKRLKRFESTVSRRGSEEDDDDDDDIPISPRPLSFNQEIADSEDESDDEIVPSASQGTDLESALPLVKTDKEAIAEYESRRAAATGDLNLDQTLGERKCIEGKSSIYVDAFNLTLDTVLQDESHLFKEAEMAVFNQWRQLTYEAQHL